MPLTLRFHTPSFATPLERPLLAWPVKAGFPSPPTITWRDSSTSTST
jgi:hypothetical protein